MFTSRNIKELDGASKIVKSSVYSRDGNCLGTVKNLDDLEVIGHYSNAR